MKPTMPMNAFPPGHFGTPPPSGGGFPPPGGGGGGGWGPPPPGGPQGPQGPYGPQPPQYPPYQGPPPEPKKSRTGLYVGGCCGCLVILGCIAGGAFLFRSGLTDLFGPGDEIATTTVTPNQPYTVQYEQDGDQKYQAWMEVDVDYTSGYNLNGTILLSANGTPFGQYTLSESGSGSPVTERSSSTRFNWTSTNMSGNGSASGMVSLFPIPAQADGALVTLTGTINTPPGVTGTIRIFVAKRND
jgi:hypothetical protein